MNWEINNLRRKRDWRSKRAKYRDKILQYMTSTQELIVIHNDAARKSWSKYIISYKLPTCCYLYIKNIYNTKWNTTYNKKSRINRERVTKKKRHINRKRAKKVKVKTSGRKFLNHPGLGIFAFRALMFELVSKRRRNALTHFVCLSSAL